MKFSVLALAGAVSAAAIQQRQSDQYYIGQFKADAIAHSTQATYSFNIGDGSGLPPVECSASLAAFRDTEGASRLPNVISGECDATEWTWNAARTVDGDLQFSVQNRPTDRYSVLYCYNMPASNFTITQDTPGFFTEHYQGYQYFVVGFGDCASVGHA